MIVINSLTAAAKCQYYLINLAAPWPAFNPHGETAISYAGRMAQPISVTR